MSDWLSLFHAGDRTTLEACYREHFNVVKSTASRFVSGADLETIIHEVFYTLFADPQVRAHFTGGSLSAYLVVMTKNRAIDYLRRQKREAKAHIILEQEHLTTPAPTSIEETATARRLISNFKEQCLPGKWVPVFEARFIKHLSQRDAAKQLGMSRTTLAYQEIQIRRRLRRFLLQEQEA